MPTGPEWNGLNPEPSLAFVVAADLTRGEARCFLTFTSRGFESPAADNGLPGTGTGWIGEKGTGGTGAANFPSKSAFFNPLEAGGCCPRTLRCGKPNTELELGLPEAGMPLRRWNEGEPEAEVSPLLGFRRGEEGAGRDPKSTIAGGISGGRSPTSDYG